MHYKTKLKNIDNSCEIVRLPDEARGFVTGLLSENFKGRDLVFVAKNDAEIERIAAQITYFAPQIEENYEILQFFSWNLTPYEKNSPKQEVSAARIKVLNRIANRQDKNFLAITSVDAVLQKIIAPKQIRDTSLSLKAGDRISIKQIADFLVFNGYQRQSCAYTVGEFALRGGIVDIVVDKNGEAIGHRLDFFGEDLESIKEFDILTQISSSNLREIELMPASEVVLNEETIANFKKNYRQHFAQNFSLEKKDPIYEAVSSGRLCPGLENYLALFYEDDLVDFLSYFDNPVVFWHKNALLQAKEVFADAVEAYKLRLKDMKHDEEIYNVLAPEFGYFDKGNLAKILASTTNIAFNNFDCDDKNARQVDLEIKPVPDFNLAARANRKDPLLLLQEFVGNIDAKTKIFVATDNQNSKDRLEKLMLDVDLHWPIAVVGLGKGFMADDLVFIGDEALFGEKAQRRKKSRNANAVKKILEESTTLSPGDLVVHRDYGIGKFEGIEKVKTGNFESDMVKISYGGGDILFVSVEDINLITRYGDANSLVELDRLGVAAWKNRKSKVKKRIKIAAEELIKTAAQRHVRKANIFAPNQHFYDEFRAQFGFVETDDQMTAIEDVENDLAKGSPMDRLVCGDVGFGKTEVAMRAAFIVANKGHQVAVITPTTLLCRQHFKNFVKRFEGTDVKIAQLSRLNSVTRNREVKEKLKNGEVDVVIGTHALLAKNVEFKNLSLLIVDEEQHFGVAQKERLKEFRREVHILTLSATPIPRTLQMSLTGVKDLSLIATPPLNRLSVKNFVMKYDKNAMKEAILREYQRMGQVFLVVPRVKYIDEIEKTLTKILPESIRVTHAHGRMTPSELDKIMNDFYDGKIDVLLSTTIIESGIDVASANTMIIYKAEMFGLAQLYQLRGRVGRGKVRGYAYFMLSDKKIKKEAKKKLEVMQHLDDLGVGFTIASHDMDIRGGGDILGDEQSGHIKETGVELYQQMLLEEIEKQKNVMLDEERKRGSEGVSSEEGRRIGAGHSSNYTDAVKFTKTELNCQEKNFLLDSDFNPQVKLGISLAISEEYIDDLELRMAFYRKIAGISGRDGLEDIKNELADRFGEVPEATKNLLEVSLLRYECKKQGIARLEVKKDGIMVAFKNDEFYNPDGLLKMVFAPENAAKLMPNNRVLFAFAGLGGVLERVKAAETVLERIGEV